MRLFKREEEGGITVADWDDGFVGLSQNQGKKRTFNFGFERWHCCPGAFELNIELLGLMFVIYNEGGPCQLETYFGELDEPEFEVVAPASQPVPLNGSDWRSIPSPAAH